MGDAPPWHGLPPFRFSFDGAALTGAFAVASVRELERLMRVIEAHKPVLRAASGEGRDG